MRGEIKAGGLAIIIGGSSGRNIGATVEIIAFVGGHSEFGIPFNGRVWGSIAGDKHWHVKSAGAPLLAQKGNGSDAFALAEGVIAESRLMPIDGNEDEFKSEAGQRTARGAIRQEYVR